MTETVNVTAVEIAKDVIALLNAKKLVATKGTYGDFNYRTRLELTSSYDGSFQPIIQSPNFQCEACALGGLFIAYVDKFNSVNLDNGNRPGSERMVEILAPFFGNDEHVLYQIESYFEGWGTRGTNFYYKNPDADTRLRKICQNIIDNNGTFDGTQLT